MPGAATMRFPHRARKAASMITVHHLNNSRSQRVLWLLEELGLPYEIKKYQRDAQDDAGAARAARGPSARQVAGRHRRRRHRRRVGRDHRVPAREATATAVSCLPAGTTERLRFTLLAALRRRLGDAAAAAQADLRPASGPGRCRSSSSRSRAASRGKVKAADGRAEPEAPARLHGERARPGANGSRAMTSAPPTSR